jgi:hypothetical protein
MLNPVPLIVRVVAALFTEVLSIMGFCALSGRVSDASESAIAKIRNKGLHTLPDIDVVSFQKLVGVSVRFQPRAVAG